MDSVKPWYMSKTVLASLVAIASIILSAFGFPLDETVQMAATDVLLQIVGVVASLVAIVGRFSATKQIA